MCLYIPRVLKLCLIILSTQLFIYAHAIYIMSPVMRRDAGGRGRVCIHCTLYIRCTYARVYMDYHNVSDVLSYL